MRPTSVETVIRHPNTPAIVLLGAITAASWLWIFAVANVYGPGASMMALRWDATHALLIWIMWAEMMAGMMLPSACANGWRSLTDTWNCTRCRATACIRVKVPLHPSFDTAYTAAKSASA